MKLQFQVSGAMLGLVILSASPVSGQIVTPPPAKSPNVDDHIERLPAPPPPFNVQGNGGKAPIQIKAPGVKPRPARVEAPDMKFESIVKRDAQGKLIRLAEPVDVAALRNNPALKPGFMTEIADVLAERKAAFRRVAIDNLDIVEQIDTGAIDKADLSSKAGITALVNLLKPLTGKSVPERLTRDLVEKEKITPEQGALNSKIMKEYQDALLPQAPGKDATPEQRSAFSHQTIGAIQYQNVSEVMLSFEETRREALANLAKYLPTDLDKAESGKLLAAAKGMGPDSAPADITKAYRELVSGLNIDQRREILRKAAAASTK